MKPLTTSVPSTRPPTTRSPAPGDVLASLLPSAAYLAAHAWKGPTTAMLVASTATAAIILARRRRGVPVGVLLPAALIYLGLRTAISMATGSELIYFGTGLVLNAAVALVVGATAFTRTPAATHLLPLVVRYRHLNPAHPLYRRVAAHVTGAWAVAELVATALEAKHLTNASGIEFVLTRTMVVLPSMAGVVFLLIFYVRARLDPVEIHLAQRHDVLDTKELT